MRKMKHQRINSPMGGRYAPTLSLFLLMFFALSAQEAFGQELMHPFLLQIKKQAIGLRTAFASGNKLKRTQADYSPLAVSFLEAADSLEAVKPRKIYVQKNPRSYLSPSRFRILPQEERESYSEQSCDEKLYYGHYSTPLAWARPFDRLGQYGFSSFEGKRVIDFGFGNVGQLRMMASLGAKVTGIEISNSIPNAMYHFESDQGEVRKISDEIESNGELKLVFGKWPASKDIIEDVGGGFDLFISKNVLKYGYIHPERDAPATQLIDLGVDDKKFLTILFNALNPGGFVLIYNIHPPKSQDDERYKPWAYGETPWDKELVEQVGFKILEWHIDDSDAIHDFGRVIDWNKSFPSDEAYQANFRAMYTILRKQH